MGSHTVRALAQGHEVILDNLSTGQSGHFRIVSSSQDLRDETNLIRNLKGRGFEGVLFRRQITRGRIKESAGHVPPEQRRGHTTPCALQAADIQRLVLPTAARNPVSTLLTRHTRHPSTSTGKHKLVVEQMLEVVTASSISMPSAFATNAAGANNAANLGEWL